MPNCSVPAFTRGETPHWTYPCGCQASALRLAYCPLHAAAEEMREALKALVAVTGPMLEQASYPPTPPYSLHVATDTARALLAKVQ